MNQDIEFCTWLKKKKNVFPPFQSMYIFVFFFLCTSTYNACDIFTRRLQLIYATDEWIILYDTSGVIV